SQSSATYHAPFVLNAKGQILIAPLAVETDSDGYNKALLTQIRQAVDGSFMISLPHEGTVWCVFRSFEPWGWTIGYLVPLTVKYQLANQLTRLLWFVFGGITLMVTLLLVWLVRGQLKPISELTEISAEMAEGNLERTIQTGRKDEIGILADHFNRMQFVMKQTIESLQSSEENLRTTLNSLADAVIATDADMCVIRMNPVAEKLTGWSVDSAIGEPLSTVFQIFNAASRQPLENPAIKVLAQNKIVSLSKNRLLISKNGEEFLVSDTAAPIKNADDQITGVVLVFRDITEEKALQEQLLQTRKMDTIGQLAGGVAHDFNNMLGGIIGAAELLKRKLPKDPKCDKYLGMIMDSAEQATNLTSQLLTFARKQHIHSTPIDVHLVLDNTLSLFEKTVDRRIRVSFNRGADTCMVVGDSTQLQNAFLNLCINAAQAMPDGGDILISSQNKKLDKIYCDNSAFKLEPGPYLDIQFRDCGCGISEEHLSKVFEPFYTTKELGQGTGLGLSAVLGTVQAHNGEVSVYSEIGKGTVFQVLLPLTEAEAEDLPTTSQPQCGSGLILIVDDEHVMRDTAGAILEDLGYQVLLAENGQVGLDLYRQNKNKIDLVLLDMIMPEMNGRDCFCEIRKINPNAKVILLSGFTKSQDLNDLRAAGLSGFIRKPYRAAGLSEIIADAMSSGDKRQFFS
ncbi:MAG: response regulator, partial [Desulfuromusa sp.]|nr:response regulator [Desulfuromusa sp.]